MEHPCGAPSTASTIQIGHLARALLSGEISDGDTVLVDLDDSAAGGTGARTVTRAA